MSDMTVAKTILEQLGGRMFLAMTGARDMVGSDDSLMMRLPNTTKGNGVKFIVALTAMDDYTLTIGRMDGVDFKELDKREGVYCDNLRAVFTDMTGLYTSLAG